MIRLWQALVVIWAARTSWLAAACLLGHASVARRHVETSAFVLVALLLPALARLRHTRHTAPDVPAGARVWPVAALVFPAAALALYWPAVHIGLLSDDFTLVAWARSGTLLDDSWGLVRPVPLALWSLLDVLAGPRALPVVVHLVNILLHGINAALVARLAQRFGLPARRALVAGALFLVWPTHVEPVAWAAGVFDVLLTLVVLTAVSIGTGSLRLSPSAMGVVALLVGAAVGTKETGVVAPLLLGLAVFQRFGCQRADGYRAALGGAAVAAVYALWRLQRGVPDEVPPLTGYAAKELLSRPFGALAAPFHDDVVMTWSVAAAVAVAAVPMLIAARALNPGTARLLAVAALWVLFAVAPLFTIFFVGPDLQGARYLYLAAAAWVMLLAARVPGLPRAWRLADGALVAAGILFFALVVRLQLEPWTEAAALRDRTLRAIAERAATCPVVALEERPDHVRGAYIFRNGLEEALLARGVDVRLAESGAVPLDLACTIPAVR